MAPKRRPDKPHRPTIPHDVRKRCARRGLYVVDDLITRWGKRIRQWTFYDKVTGATLATYLPAHQRLRLAYQTEYREATLDEALDAITAQRSLP